MPDNINAGNCSNPAPPPEIAEKVLEKKEIKKIEVFLYKEWSKLSTKVANK